MNWDRIEDDRIQFNGSVIDLWDDLTENRVGSRIRETYDMSEDVVDSDRTGWQQRLSEIARTAH